jgi:hypothetical protein
MRCGGIRCIDAKSEKNEFSANLERGGQVSVFPVGEGSWEAKSKKQAIVAVARRIAELLYTLMRDGTKYEARPFIRVTGDELARLVTSA